MLRRYLKYSVVGATSLGLLVNLHKNDYQIGAIGVVRVGRAAYTVGCIAWDYKYNLFSKNLDKKSEEYSKLKSEVHQMGASKLLELCRTNKGVYIKVGQHIGALDYLLPNEYVHTMRILHKDAPSNTVDMLHKVIKEDLKKDASELFDTFEPSPLGTASLAQVHKATLKDGTTVAVKVQHYFVRRSVKTDLKTMEYLVKVMSWLFPDFQMQWLVDETKKNIYRELNFEEEGHNSEKLAGMFKNYSWLKIPKVYWDYTTKRVLVMEYVEGGQVNDYDYIKKNNIDPYDLSRKLGDLYSHMIFIHGFVHSDPHPGNILVSKSPGDKSVNVYLLDHGLYATLSEKFRYDYAQLWLSIINRDRVVMKRQAELLGIRGDLYGLFACMVTGRPWNTIEKGIGNIKPEQSEKNVFQNELPNFITEISLCLENMDRQTLLVLKTNDLIRSIEYALGTHQRMCGFTVMTKCCIKSVNDKHFQNSKTFYDRTFLRVKNFYSMMTYYIFLIIAEFKIKFLL